MSAFVHMVVLAAGLGVVVLAELSWQRAISAAAAAGLVARSPETP